jgi:NTP pyrophosphatase (non-canonical NTP hydrolase)
MNIEKISEQVLAQNKEIELFNDDDIYSIVQMILDEAQELAEATENGFLTDDLTAVASECADVMYLLIRLFDILGIDERAIEMKVKRNYLKYSGKESKEQAIKDWKEKGGDKVWFESLLTKEDKSI